MDADKPLFFGHSLRDSEATVIHHYASSISDWQYRDGVSDSDTMETRVLAYPESAAGIVLSSALVNAMNDHIRTNGIQGMEFTIDWRYELAYLALAAGKASLRNAPWLCMQLPIQAARDQSGAEAQEPDTDNGTDQPSPDIDPNYCATVYTGRKSDEFCHSPPEGAEPTDVDRVAFAVKTYHAYHKDRVVVVKRTWADDAVILEFFSDVEDLLIPSIVVDTPNTESGHCAKTLEIMRRFLAQDHWAHVRWLVIADDDTLISVPRLVELVQCYDDTEAVIIGERYGFGFSADGTSGYDYPTGGAGMIFSKPAVRKLVKSCVCPAANSPDDMILGACARQSMVPLVHSPALHQARPPDYTAAYLSRIPPVSFHKHWEIDPTEVFDKWLKIHSEDSDQSGEGSPSNSDKDAGGDGLKSEL